MNKEQKEIVDKVFEKQILDKVDNILTLILEHGSHKDDEEETPEQRLLRRIQWALERYKGPDGMEGSVEVFLNDEDQVSMRFDTPTETVTFQPHIAMNIGKTMMGYAMVGLADFKLEDLEDLEEMEA